MFKKLNVIVLAAILTTLLFSACTGSLPFIGQSTSSASGSGSSRTGGSGSAAQFTVSPETITVIGILKLEGTNDAITADQAATLLPLYKAVKSISATAGSSPAELQALYTQVNDTLTPSQTQAITAMGITGANMRTIMSDLGIQFGGGGGGSGTRTANGNGGGFGGPGGFGGGGGVPGGSGSTTIRPTSAVSSTRQQTINPALLTAVLDLLNKRSGGAAVGTPDPASKGKRAATPAAMATATPGN